MLVHDGLGLKYVFVQSQLLIVARNLSFGGNLVCVMLKFLLDVIPLDQKKKERRCYSSPELPEKNSII